MPASPPKETIGWAPSDSAVVISPVTVGSLVTGSVSPQIGVQPLPMTNAALNALSPAWVAAWLSMGSWLLVMSAYGATAKPPPPPPPPRRMRWWPVPGRTRAIRRRCCRR